MTSNCFFSAVSLWAAASITTLFYELKECWERIKEDMHSLLFATRACAQRHTHTHTHREANTDLMHGRTGQTSGLDIVERNIGNNSRFKNCFLELFYGKKFLLRSSLSCLILHTFAFRYKLLSLNSNLFVTHLLNV